MPDTDSLPRELADAIRACWDGEPAPQSFGSAAGGLFLTDPSHAYLRLRGIRERTAAAGFSRELYASFAEALCSSFDAERALTNAERLIEEHPEPATLPGLFGENQHLLSRLAAVLGGSQYLSDSFLQDPRRIEWIREFANLEKKLSREDLLVAWRAMDDPEAPKPERLKQVRLFKKKEFARIGLRDLLRLDRPDTVLEEISHVADACMQAVLEISWRELEKKFGSPQEGPSSNGTGRPATFAVIGLGKLGGEELNFSSDIDIMYLYSDSEGETTGAPQGVTGGQRIPNHDFFIRLARDVTNSLSEVSEDGSLFRVDLRLRPEGKKGDIVYSLRSYEIYYESWGETWERQMLIKARVVAGDEELGGIFIDTVRPFVYRKYLDFSTIEEIRKIKERIDRHIISKDRDKDNLKLGWGGIREIEFIVQSLQVLYGGQSGNIRARNTIKALTRLVEGGYLEESDGRELEDAYFFLRELENRIQITFGMQTHIIPPGEKDRAVLARKMNLAGDSAAESAGALITAYERHAKNVRRIFESLFYHARPEAEEYAINFQEEGYHSSLEILRRMNFKDPVHAYNQLYALREGPPLVHTSHRSKQLFDRLVPGLIAHLQKAPDLDLGLNIFVRFFEANGSQESLYEFLLENENILSLLLLLFGSSKYLSDILIRSPESLGENLNPEQWAVEKPKERLKEELGEELKRAGTWDEKLVVLRRFKRIGELHIGMRELTYSPDNYITFRNLTDVAETYIEAAFKMALDELSARHGTPLFEPPEGGKTISPLAIIGLGKLGGREMDFGSDLDMILVFGGEGMSEGTGIESIPNYLYYTKWWQKFSDAASGHTVSGPGYKIDLRLRPEGKKGAILQPLEGFREYFARRGEDWERMALTKARFIAGDETLGHEFMRLAEEFMYGTPLTEKTVAAIQHVRSRMEKELAKEFADKKDVKQGYGGIIDIDFTVEILQLKHGRDNPAVRQTNTLDAILGLSRAGALSALESAMLQDSYQFLRKVENRLRIVHDESIHSFSSSTEEITPLARRLGYEDRPPFNAGDQLMHDYQRHTGNVRRIFNGVIQRLA